VATRQTQDQEVEIDPDMDPTTSEVTRPSDLGFQTNQPRHREIEVEPLEDKPVAVDSQGYVEVRMADTIEEFTYGNPHYTYRLEQGKRYRIPVEVARYLNNLGYIYHRG
jgi:hypothetical protein